MIDEIKRALLLPPLILFALVFFGVGALIETIYYVLNGYEWDDWHGYWRKR